GQLEERYFKFSLEPLTGVDGRPDGVILVAVEVTDHVRSRQAIERAHREREQLLVELSAASRAKDEFLAMLAHELRNPLSPIRNAAALLGASGEGAAERQARARDVITRQ
ncbi:hypothetical protein LTR94_035541, partial [Friedmanniomyces endolithicus]